MKRPLDCTYNSHNLCFQAYFYQNIVRNNRHNHDALLSASHAYHPASYTLGVKGVQKFNITDNIFGNQGKISIEKFLL